MTGLEDSCDLSNLQNNDKLALFKKASVAAGVARPVTNDLANLDREGHLKWPRISISS